MRLVRIAIQPGVDLAHALGRRLAPPGRGLTLGSGLFDRSQRQDRGRLNEVRLSCGLEFQRGQAAVQLLLSGEGIPLIGLGPQPVHLVAMPLGQRIRPLKRHDLAHSRTGQQGDGKGERDAHGFNMGPDPADAKRGRNPLGARWF